MHRINRQAPFHHDHFPADCLASGMHTAFLVAAGVALAGALIGLLIRPGNGGGEAVHAGI